VSPLVDGAEVVVEDSWLRLVVWSEMLPEESWVVVLVVVEDCGGC